MCWGHHDLSQRALVSLALPDSEVPIVGKALPEVTETEGAANVHPEIDQANKVLWQGDSWDRS